MWSSFVLHRALFQATVQNKPRKHQDRHQSRAPGGDGAVSGEGQATRPGRWVPLAVLCSRLQAERGWAWREPRSIPWALCKCNANQRVWARVGSPRPDLSAGGRSLAPACWLLVLPFARALAGPLAPVPPRPGRAWRARRAARSQPAAERARSPGCAPAAGAPLRAQCLGSRAAFTARVSEPAPRFCPRRPPGVTLRRGFGGRNPPWKHALDACVGEGLLRAARSWEGGVRGRPLRL